MTSARPRIENVSQREMFRAIAKFKWMQSFIDVKVMGKLGRCALSIGLSALLLSFVT